MVSKVAAKSASPFKEIFQVKEGTEPEFLAPLPITVLPVVREMAKKNMDTSFDDLNLKMVSDILNLDFYALEIAFGKKAQVVFEMARGIDQTPLYPSSLENIIFEESYLEEDTNDLVILRSILSHHLERATFRMRKEGIYAQKLRLSLRYSDFKFVSKEKKLKKESFYVQDFSPIIFEMFQRIYTRRTRVRFLSLEFLDLKTSEIQLSLFEEKKLNPVIGSVLNGYTFTCSFEFFTFRRTLSY
jgi:DNA polymerase-4